MLNQVIYVGRLKDYELIEYEDKQAVELTLIVQRTFKDEEGNYGVDLIDCIVTGMLKDNVETYLHKGDLVGIKGRFATRLVNNVREAKIIVDKITFLSRQEGESNNEDSDTDRTKNEKK